MFKNVARTAKQHHQGETQDGVENTAEVAAGNSGGRRGGRAAIDEILGRAAEGVQQLDAIMHNKYARDPAKLHAWQTASRVERAPQREKKPGGPNTPPAP